jgi:hypothetical protein
VFNTATPQLTNWTLDTGAGTVVFHPTDGLASAVKTTTAQVPVYAEPDIVVRVPEEDTTGPNTIPPVVIIPDPSPPPGPAPAPIKTKLKIQWRSATY